MAYICEVLILSSTCFVALTCKLISQAELINEKKKMYQRNKMELNINASAIHVCMATVLSEQLILHACEVSQFF